VSRVGRSLATLPKQLVQILVYVLLFRWLTDLLGLIGARSRERGRGKQLRDGRRGRNLSCSPRCSTIGPDVYRRADPLIYSQQYLMEQGLAVTWDNPDIQIFKAGVPVSSSSLEPDTDYEIVATIYNNSTDAPAVGMPVDFTVRDFGVGTQYVLLGTTTIDLPVKGAPGHPARASMPWHTPPVGGHNCLRVFLRWDDDANPKNNLGQENTSVAAATSPAVFRFPVRNEDTIPKRLHLAVDAYGIPARKDCRDKDRRKQEPRENARYERRTVFIPPSEANADWNEARARHDPAAFPVPPDWSVSIQPEALDLSAGEQREVVVSIEPPDSFQGEKSFNVNALHGEALVGGVTLTVTR
jgi:hypothetical protein